MKKIIAAASVTAIVFSAYFLLNTKTPEKEIESYEKEEEG